MNISPISFGTTKIIDFSNYKKPTNNHSKTEAPQDTFEKSLEEQPKQQDEEITLATQTQELSNYITEIRQKSREPIEIAKDMTNLLNSKETRAAFQAAFDADDVDEIDKFYDLTTSLIHRLKEPLEDSTYGHNTYVLLDMALNPYDDLYEDFCIKCDDLYGDEETPDRIIYMLNSLVDTDDPNCDEETAKRVIKTMAESIHEEFEQTDNPTFSVDLTVDDKYDPEKCLNAFKNFLALVTLSKNSKQEQEKHQE